MIEVVVDELLMNGKKIDQRKDWVPMARIKYWFDGREGDQLNQGKIASKKHSIIGRQMAWTGVGKWLSFRLSSCKEVRYFIFWRRWRTLNFGTNGRRFVFKWKYQKVEGWQ